MLVGLIAAHLLLALAAPLLTRWLGQRAFLVAALVPAAAFGWLVSVAPTVLAGDAVVQRYEWIAGLNVALSFRLGLAQWVLGLIVTVAPPAVFPAPGLCWAIVPAGRSESTGPPTCTWKPAPVRVWVAWSCDIPTTFGRSRSTYRVRLLCGAGNCPPGYHWSMAPLMLLAMRYRRFQSWMPL